jgi:hypothetical protein
MKLRLRASLALLLSIAMARTSLAATTYNFTLQSPSGVTTTSASATANTTGTLIGAWDVTSNPTDTRTKPGLFGTFGDTENLPVNTTLNFATSGTPSIPQGGAFALAVDIANNSILLSNYSSFMSSAASGSLATSATITTENFRTRSPTSTYPGGIPVTLPIGNGSITSLDVAQTADVTGILSPTANPNQFNFTIAVPVEVTLGVDLTGNNLLLGPAPTLLALQGTLDLNGNTATLSALAPLDINDQQNPALALPPIPFALPTVIPTGGTANVIFNLTLNQVTTGLQGSVAINANGVVVPEPAGAAVLLCSVGVLRRRRGLIRHSRFSVRE